MPTDPILQYQQTIDDAVEIFIDKTVTEDVVDKWWLGVLLVEVDEPHPNAGPIPIIGGNPPRTRHFNNVVCSSNLKDLESGGANDFTPEFKSNAMNGVYLAVIGLAQVLNIPPDQVMQGMDVVMRAFVGFEEPPHE